MTQKQKTFLIIFVILVLTLFARFWKITEIPGGLFPDQAANGEDAISILHGNFQPFYVSNNGREGLFFYLQAVCIALFGIKVWPMFFASALVGAATVIASYFAAKRIFGNKVATFSALFMATNQWHVTLSRDGFRANMTPLFIALTFFFCAGIFNAKTSKSRLWNSIAAGISFGLGFYTYIAYRAFLGVIIVGFVLLLIQSLFKKPRLKSIKEYYKPIALFFIFSVITLIPLGVFFVSHPDYFASRTSQVSITNPDLNKGDLIGTAGEVFSKSFLAFFAKGDTNYRHNVSGFPFFSPFPAMLFGLGLIICLAKSFKYLHELFRGKKPGKYFAHVIMLVLFLVMLLPEIATAEGIPHGLRSIGVIPGVFWIAGLGGAFVIDKIRKINYLSVRKIVYFVFAAALLFTSIYDLYLYFGVAARSEGFAEAYNANLTVVSNHLKDRASKGLPKPYIVIDGFSDMTVHFLTTDYEQPYVKIEKDEALKLVLKKDEELIYLSDYDAQNYASAHPNFIKEIYNNKFDKPTMVIFK